MLPDQRADVVIEGGGIAALEAMIALYDLAPSGTHVTLVAPGPDCVLPAGHVGESFGLGRRGRIALGRAAEDFDIAGGAGEGVAGPGAAWWPPSKTFARRLSPYLFGVRESEPAAR